MYHHGCGTPVDTSLTLKYYKMSADQGYPRALYIMGYLYYEGIGVLKDKCEEIKYYKLAADKGNSAAGCELAKMYERGNGVPRSYKLAVEYLLKAALVYVDNTKAKSILTQIFKGSLGEEYKQSATEYLSEYWPKYHQLLHPNCQNAIIELFYSMKNRDTPPPIELVWVMVPNVIMTWPEPHFEHFNIN